MVADTHAFAVGTFRCLAVRDGLFNYPLESFFANAPREELESALRRRSLPLTQIATPYTCLFIDTGPHRVMVDTGAGTLGGQAAAFFPTVDHTTTVTGRLALNLAAAGIAPDSVDAVIVTHAHPDHVGGTLDEHGELVFKNARYYVGEREWNFWFSETAVERTPPTFVKVARTNLDAFRERVDLVAYGDEVVPGIRAVAAPGHTPGHLALAVSSGEEQLLHISDVVLHPLHLEHPAWRPAFDMDAEEAERTKRSIFDRAAEEEALVFAHHFPPFPSLGRVRLESEGWTWEPIADARNPPASGGS